MCKPAFMFLFSTVETSGEVVLPFLNEERQNVYEANENAML